MSRSRVLSSLFGRSALLLESVSVGHAAKVDPRLHESTSNSGSADSVGFCQTILTLARDVSGDEIVDVKVSAFQGFVYSVSCENGWFFADGIVAHNCRCTIVGYNAITASLARTDAIPA